MNFLDEIVINNTSIKFWSGFDIQRILKHPKDGTNGFMVVLVDSIESEKVKFQRECKLNEIFNKKSEIDFDKLIEKLDNNFLALYQSRGENELLINILKEKFSKTLDWQRFTSI